MYRAEHPKPQFERKNWLNLNGRWQFEIDQGNSGAARGYDKEDAVLNSEIEVPFCPESKLSGIGYVDFMSSVWYKREVELSAKQLKGRVVLHFGAADYVTTIYINGKECGTHKGGYVSFSFDVTGFVREGKNVITVHVEDDTRNPLIPCGKQCGEYYSYGCAYTRTTGIWQTVWLEFTPETYIKNVRYYPDIHTAALTITAETCGAGTFTAQTFFDGKPTGEAHAESNGGALTVTVNLTEKHLWEVGKGGLYDLRLTYGDDEVKSYFGLRNVRLEGYKFLINEKSVFQRLVLDQGFYPDGIYTAPSDGDLEADIDLSMAMGFNGARLHEKIFEERFLYHCDKKGYVVWGEFPNWGIDHSRAESVFGILPEWLEELARDFNHPAIVGWCPFNETWDYAGRCQNNDVLRVVYQATKSVDPTRPCIDTSGHFHVITDIFDVHDYDQNPQTFAEHYNALMNDGTLYDPQAARQTYKTGMPVFVSEYGGIRWTKEEKGWGYGNAPATEEEFLSRLEGLTDVLLNNNRMFGLCYTQLYDVEQEQNGLYTYCRKPKFPPETIKKIFSKKAAIED